MLDRSIEVIPVVEYRAVLDSFQIPAAATEASPGHVDSLVAFFKGQSNRCATRHLVEIVEIVEIQLLVVHDAYRCHFDHLSSDIFCVPLVTIAQPFELCPVEFELAKPRLLHSLSLSGSIHVRLRSDL